MQNGKDEMNVILLGAPGAGKGTLAEGIVKNFGLTHLSTGNIFRREVAAKSELGIKISEIIKSGKLVSDDMVFEVVSENIKNIDNGILFDGFPRTLTQAEKLDDFFSKENKKISVVIFINLDEKEVLNRLSLRRSCKVCKAIYNLVSKPSKTENVCDKCGGELYLRNDDKPETVKERLTIFKKQTEPLVEYYKYKHNFFEVNGVGLPSEVAKRVFDILRAAA